MERPIDLLSFDGISAFCFNKDYTQCAVCHKDQNIIIYKVTSISESSKWQKLHTLKSVSKI